MYLPIRFVIYFREQTDSRTFQFNDIKYSFPRNPRNFFVCMILLCKNIPEATFKDANVNFDIHRFRLRDFTSTIFVKKLLIYAKKNSPLGYVNERQIF